MPDRDTNSLIFGLNNTQPVELSDFTQSLSRLSEEYSRVSELLPGPPVVRETRLFIKEVRKGSIIAEIQALVPYAMPFVSQINSVSEFAGYLRQAISFLLNRAEKPDELTRKGYENIAQIVEPLVKDKGATLVIAGDHNRITINNVEANAIQNTARRELKEMSSHAAGFKQMVLLYFYQARNDAKSDRGDRAIIESIYDGPVRTVFAKETIKAHILASSDNIFERAYIVDVAVETVHNKPRLYRVLRLHESVER